MMDREVSVSISLADITAWCAWSAVCILFTICALTDEIYWALLGLASSAVAATMHMRCFTNRLERHLSAAYSLGQENERVRQLRTNP